MVNVTDIQLIPDLNCTFESIRIYESGSVQTYCGHVPPCPVLLKATSVLVVFTVADLGNFGGFSLEFEEVAKDYMLPDTCDSGLQRYSSFCPC